MCTVGGRIGWIVTRSGTARRPGIPGTTTPLSTQGNTNYCDDKKIFNDVKRRFSDQDTECLDHLNRRTSLASHIAIKTHANYPAYQLPAIGALSYAFYIMIRDIRSIGNGATKLHRTRKYTNITKSDLPHEAYIDLVNSMTETFKLDFEDRKSTRLNSSHS